MSETFTKQNIDQMDLKVQIRLCFGDHQRSALDIQTNKYLNLDFRMKHCCAKIRCNQTNHKNSPQKAV